MIGWSEAAANDVVDFIIAELSESELHGVCKRRVELTLERVHHGYQRAQIRALVLEQLAELYPPDDFSRALTLLPRLGL